MPVDITPTDKPQAETSDVKFVPATNIPGSGSDDENIIAVVQSERAIDEPIAFNNAENGGDPERKLTKKELKKIADDIQLILDNNPDCLKTINAILEIAQTDANPIVSKNPLDVFWAIAQQGGFYIKKIDNGGEATGTIGDPVDRRWKKVPASVDLMPRNFDLSSQTDIPISKAGAYRYRRTQELARAQTALAEVIHLSGAFSYDDRDMSRAVAKYLKIASPEYPFKTVEDVGNWSRWWHPKVYKFCDKVRVMNNESKRRR